MSEKPTKKVVQKGIENDSKCKPLTQKRKRIQYKSTCSQGAQEGSENDSKCKPLTQKRKRGQNKSTCSQGTQKKSKNDSKCKPLAQKRKKSQNKARCGLCNSGRKRLTKTPCCNNWICDDEHTYVMFSFSRNSCYRNHDRYTLCSNHFEEKHKGKWQDCKVCKDTFTTPQYVTMGTNEYNFEKLENPEEFSVSCANCGFSAGTLDAFPVHSSQKGYFCAKEECQKVVFPH